MKLYYTLGQQWLLNDEHEIWQYLDENGIDYRISAAIDTELPSTLNFRALPVGSLVRIYTILADETDVLAICLKFERVAILDNSKMNSIRNKVRKFFTFKKAAI